MKFYSLKDQLCFGWKILWTVRMNHNSLMSHKRIKKRCQISRIQNYVEMFDSDKHVKANSKGNWLTVSCWPSSLWASKSSTPTQRQAFFLTAGSCWLQPSSSDFHSRLPLGFWVCVIFAKTAGWISENLGGRIGREDRLHVRMHFSLNLLPLNYISHVNTCI